MMILLNLTMNCALEEDANFAVNVMLTLVSACT